MRVAFVGTRGIPVRYGGFETAVQEISTRFVQRGHEAVVYCRREPGEDITREYRGVQKIYPPRLRLRSADTLSHTFFSFLHLVFHRVDVALVFNPANGPLCIIPRVARIPFAVNVDGLEWRRGKWGPLGKRYLLSAAWLCARLAPEIIADSRGIQRFYRTHFDRVSNFIAYGALPEHSERPELIREFGLEPEEYFLVVARLEPENNTDLVLKAFEKVGTRKRLVVVGDVNYSSRYVDRLRETSDDRILFTGAIYDQARLSELMCNCLAYIHGHEVGGTNPVLLKALGCGACVVYLDNEFNREVAGPAGIGVKKSTEALRSALQELADHPDNRRPYTELSRKRIRERYDWERVTDSYERLCLKLRNARL